MTLEQAKELEVNRWMLVNDEARLLGLEPINNPKTRTFFNAVKAWGESLADVRSHQSVEERTTEAAEASYLYITAKKAYQEEQEQA